MRQWHSLFSHHFERKTRHQPYVWLCQTINQKCCWLTAVCESCHGFELCTRRYDSELLSAF